MTSDTFLTVLAPQLKIDRTILASEWERIEKELQTYGEKKKKEIEELVELMADYNPALAWEFFRNSPRVVGLTDTEIPVKLAALGCAITERDPLLAPFIVREAAGMLTRADFDTVRMVASLCEAINRFSPTYARRVWDESLRLIEAVAVLGSDFKVLPSIYVLILQTVQTDWSCAFRLLEKFSSVVSKLEDTAEEDLSRLIKWGEQIVRYGAPLLESYLEGAYKVFLRKDLPPPGVEPIWTALEAVAKNCPESAKKLLNGLEGFVAEIEKSRKNIGRIFDDVRRLGEKSGPVAVAFINTVATGADTYGDEDVDYIHKLVLSLVPSGHLVAHKFVLLFPSLWKTLKKFEIEEFIRVISEVAAISPEVAIRLIEVSPPILVTGQVDAWRLVGNFSFLVSALDRSAAMRFLERAPSTVGEMINGGGEELLELAFREAKRLTAINSRVAVTFLEYAPAIYRVGGGQGLQTVADTVSGFDSGRWSAAVALMMGSPAVMERIGLLGFSLLARISRNLATNESYGATSLWNKVPDIIDRLGGKEAGLIFKVLAQVDTLAERNGRIALSLLEIAPQVNFLVRSRGLDVLLQTAPRIAGMGNVGKRLVDLSPMILEQLGIEGWEALVELVVEIYRSSEEGALRVLEGCPIVLDGLEEIGASAYLLEIYKLAGLAAKRSIELALNVIEKAPKLIEWLGISGFSIMTRHLIHLAESDEKQALSVFSAPPESWHLFATDLPKGVTIKEVKPILSGYLKALLGWRVEIMEAKRASTDGRRIYLPSRIREYVDWEDNFRTYKVMATFEEARLEWGGWDFSWEKLGDLSEEIVKKYGRSSPQKGAEDDLARFCALFPEPALMGDLIEIMENYRLEQILLREYPGLKQDIEMENRHRIKKRVPIGKLLNMKRRAVELIARGLMAGVECQETEEPLSSLSRRAWEKAKVLLNTEANIYTSTRVAAEIYTDITEVIGDPYRRRLFPPNHQNENHQSVSHRSYSRASHELERHLKGVPPGGERGGIGIERESREKGESSPIDHSPSRVGNTSSSRRDKGANSTWRGKEVGTRGEGGTNRTAGEAPGHVQGMYSLEKIQRLLKAVHERHGLTPEEVERRVHMMLPYEAFLFIRSLEHSLEDAVELMEEPGTFLYPEWSEDIKDYRPNWVRIREHHLPGGSLDFYRETVDTHRGLIKRIRREFQLLRPDSFKKKKRERDGTDIDLDAFVEYLIDCRLKISPKEGNYIMPTRNRRDIAVSFLIDMSRSTKGAVIEKEKEALIVMSEALNEVGDAFAIFGFSGDNRDNVDFYIVKAFEEPYGEKVKGRISSITDRFENRDGAAIRHATYILKNRRERSKILILISDGKPVDKEYHGDYAVEDTRMALKEAYHAGVRSFCITVDKEAADYLPRMYSPSRWIVIDEVAKLPERITGIYRMLTA